MKKLYDISELNFQNRVYDEDPELLNKTISKSLKKLTRENRVQTQYKNGRLKEKSDTQAHVASALGFETSTVSGWYTGNSQIPFVNALKVCNYFNCDIDHLLGKISEKTHPLTDVSEYTGLCSEAIEVLHTLKDNKADFNICLINEILTGIYNSEEYKQLQAQRSNQEPLSDLEQMPVSIFDYMYQFLHCGGAKLYHKEKGQYRESSAFNEAVFRVPVTHNVDTEGSVSTAYGANDMFFELSNASDLYKTHLANKIMQMLEDMKADNERLK